MIDITLCDENLCPRKKSCVRYRDDRKGVKGECCLSFFLHSPLNMMGECVYYRPKPSSE